MNKVTKSGQAATSTMKWKYEEQMSFLRPLSKDRTRITRNVGLPPQTERSSD